MQGAEVIEGKRGGSSYPSHRVTRVTKATGIGCTSGSARCFSRVQKTKSASM